MSAKTATAKKPHMSTNDNGGTVAEDATLRAEVASLAAELGLGSAAAENGFDDSDFRPQKAKQSIGRPAAKQGTEPPAAPSGKLKAAKPGRGAADQAPRGQRPREAAGNEQQVKERTWNAGIGPRPGRPPRMQP